MERNGSVVSFLAWRGDMTLPPRMDWIELASVMGHRSVPTNSAVLGLGPRSSVFVALARRLGSVVPANFFSGRREGVNSYGRADIGSLEYIYLRASFFVTSLGTDDAALSGWLAGCERAAVHRRLPSVAAAKGGGGESNNAPRPRPRSTQSKGCRCAHTSQYAHTHKRTLASPDALHGTVAIARRKEEGE